MRAPRGTLVAVARIVGVAGALFALSCFSPLHAQPARTSSLAVRAADVDVALDSMGVARVHERFTLATSAPSLELERLDLPCSVIDSIDLRIDGRITRPTSDAHAPWVRYTLANATDIELSYTVEPRGRELAIPLVAPRAPLVRASTSIAASRRDGVVRVRLSSPNGARVLLPRLAPLGDTLWTESLIGVPSMLRVTTVRSRGAAPCETPLAGESGNFALLVGCFIGTLVVWVPLYLWWAARRSDVAE